jgi:hypothetical protein
MISHDQKLQLAQRLDRKDTLEQQWYHIWDIIFPDTPRPASVYRGNNIDEAISIMRLLWEHRGRDILSSIASETISSAKIRAAGVTSVSAFVDVMVDTMKTAFDRLQVESWANMGLQKSWANAPSSVPSHLPTCPSEMSLSRASTFSDASTVFTTGTDLSDLNDFPLDLNFYMEGLDAEIPGDLDQAL